MHKAICGVNTACQTPYIQEGRSQGWEAAPQYDEDLTSRNANSESQTKFKHSS